jgi:hypothetical protein
MRNAVHIVTPKTSTEIAEELDSCVEVWQARSDAHIELVLP